MTSFEQLHELDSAGAPVPDARFVASLKTQIEAALTPTIELPQRKDTTMNETTQAAPAAAATQILTPYIAVHDAVGALQWYADAFDATETMRFTGDDGRIGHAEIVVHGARIFLSDAYPEIGVVAASSNTGSSCALHLEVDDVDRVHARVVATGSTEQMAPADQAHGARHSTVIDPYGIRWMLSQTIAAPTIAEIDAATDGFTVVGAGSGSRADAQPIELGYYTIHTGDIRRAARFYSTVLGWEVDAESGHVGNCKLPFGFQTDYGDGVRLWFQTKEPDAVIARVLAGGGQVIEDVVYESGRGVECRDDQGNRFDLHDPAPGYE